VTASLDEATKSPALTPDSWGGAGGPELTLSVASGMELSAESAAFSLRVKKSSLGLRLAAVVDEHHVAGDDITLIEVGDQRGRVTGKGEIAGGHAGDTENQ